MKKHGLKLVVGILIAAGLVYLLWLGIPVEDHLLVEPQIEGPDTEMIGVSMRSFSGEGVLLYELNADRMSLDSEVGEYQITQPHFTHFNNSAETWNLSAEQATIDRISDSGKPMEETIIRLSGSVLLEGPSGKFVSESLTYNPREDLVTTPDKLSMEYEGSSVVAEGLNLDLASGTYELNVGANSQMITEFNNVKPDDD